jgi:ElaB/YqjD/DUF883 family membrane-anchored ribosome-binding protein
MDLTKNVFKAPPESSGTLERAVGDGSARAHDTIDKVSDVVRPAVDRIATGAHEAVDEIARSASRTAESLDAKGERLQDAHARMTEQCRVYVRENPLAAIGIALTAGFVLSRLLKRAR